MTLRPADVAVVTPTGLRPERLNYLVELYRSLSQQLVDWQWVVAVDGASPDLVPQALIDDRRVEIVPLPRQVGAASARNLAFNHVTADWVTTADDDDLLTDTSLATRLHYARAHALDWVAAWSSDLFPDGTTRTWHCPTPPGFHQAGDVLTYWDGPHSQIPLGPTTLLARTNLVRAAGGYAGLPQGEDYAYLVGITCMGNGALIPEVAYWYRKHGSQMTAHESYSLLEAPAREWAYRYGIELTSAWRSRHRKADRAGA